MTESMVERLVKALPDIFGDAGAGYVFSEAGDDCITLNGDFSMDGIVRGLLAAMREPLESMVEAGHEHTADPCWPEDVAKAWRAMIDDALANPDG